MIHPWIQVAKWATSFSFLVAHRQHLVALASGRPVICNPASEMSTKMVNGTQVHDFWPFWSLFHVL